MTPFNQTLMLVIGGMLIAMAFYGLFRLAVEEYRR